jgi:hypothetical protein
MRGALTAASMVILGAGGGAVGTPRNFGSAAVGSSVFGGGDGGEAGSLSDIGLDLS